MTSANVRIGVLPLGELARPRSAGACPVSVGKRPRKARLSRRGVAVNHVGRHVIWAMGRVRMSVPGMGSVLLHSHLHTPPNDIHLSPFTIRKIYFVASASDSISS